MQSIIGSNAAIRYLKAYQAHIDYWKQVNPAYQLAFVDNPEHTIYIEQYAQALPDSMIVARIYHPLDGGFHLKPTAPNDTRHYVSSPVEYLSAYGWLGRKRNIILNVMNEPASDQSPDNMQRLVEWFIEYIPIAAQGDGTKSVLFNWADRNPRIIDGMMDSQFDNVLRLMAAHPDLFYMGMHFYGPDELVSHLDSYVARCTFLGIKPPRVIGTEFGIDSIGGTMRGYKTWPNYVNIYANWQEIQVKPPINPDNKTLSEHIKSGVLVGLCVFQEGNSGGFDDFDIENNQAYKTEIKRAALAGEISAPPPIVTPSPPNYIPSPFESGSMYKISTPSTLINIRNTPSTLASIVGTIPNGNIIIVTEETLLSGEYWRKINFNGLIGWISMQGGAVKFDPYIPPEQPPPDTVVIPIATLKSLRDQIDALIPK